MLVVGKSLSWVKVSPVGSASTNVVKTSRPLRARNAPPTAAWALSRASVQTEAPELRQQSAIKGLARGNRGQVEQPVFGRAEFFGGRIR